MKNNKSVELPTVAKPTIYKRIKETLTVASQLIIAAPVKLPPKVVIVAKYLVIALGVLDAMDGNGASSGSKLTKPHISDEQEGSERTGNNESTASSQQRANREEQISIKKGGWDNES